MRDRVSIAKMLHETRNDTANLPDRAQFSISKFILILFVFLEIHKSRTLSIMRSTCKRIACSRIHPCDSLL